MLILHYYLLPWGYNEIHTDSHNIRHCLICLYTVYINILTCKSISYYISTTIRRDEYENNANNIILFNVHGIQFAKTICEIVIYLFLKIIQHNTFLTCTWISFNTTVVMSAICLELNIALTFTMWPISLVYFIKVCHYWKVILINVSKRVSVTERKWICNKVFYMYMKK